MSLKTWARMAGGATGLAAALLLATPLHAGDKTDILYMKNGDRLTCEIKSMDAGALYVSLDYVDGTIAVQWSKVARLQSTNLFIVRVENGAAYSGTISVGAADADSVAPVDITSLEKDTVQVPHREIVNIGQTSDHFWRRFNVDISSGIIYSKGNQTTQYNVSSSVQYPRERWGVRASFNSSLSSSSGTTASTRNQGSLSGFHLLPWRNYFWGGAGTLLQSTETGIGLQANLGGGIGKYFSHTNRVTFSVLGGFAWQNTQYSEADSSGTEDVFAALVAGNLSVQTFSKTNLTISATALPALSEPGRFFFSTNATYYLKLWSNLTFNLSFYGNLDTKPPAGLSGSDYGFSSGLGWTFGNFQTW